MSLRMCRSKRFWKMMFVVGTLAILGFLWKTKTSSDVETPIIPCVPQSAIVFMKTHKTGSSSIQNMCMRYAVGHDLRIALPSKFNYFGHPKPFNESMVPALGCGQRYDVFTHHSRFNYDNLRDFMPENAAFFTLVREPASLFESSYAYYALGSTYGMTLEEFVSLNQSDVTKLNKRYNGRIGRNQMAFDLGVNADQFDNEEEMARVAVALDQQFHLVMIRERMNESLVLLKNLLCWSTDDVVVLHQNARAEATKKKLTPELKVRILSLNKADKVLYDYFAERFEEKVKAFGQDRMKQEVEELRTRIEQWQSYCVAGVLKDASIYGKNIEGFRKANVNNQTCDYLTKEEMAFTTQLVKKQRQFLAT